jgi:hypothetical protein
MIRVYYVHGIRHQTVVFAETPDQAIAQAIEQGLVGDWEYPEATEVPLPQGYRIVYDPSLAPIEQPDTSATPGEG